MLEMFKLIEIELTVHQTDVKISSHLMENWTEDQLVARNEKDLVLTIFILPIWSKNKWYHRKLPAYGIKSKLKSIHCPKKLQSFGNIKGLAGKMTAFSYRNIVQLSLLFSIAYYILIVSIIAT